MAVVMTWNRFGSPSTRAAENEPSISAKTKTAAPRTPGDTRGRVTWSMVRIRPAPSTWEASSRAGSIDFITAPIMTKATDPSKSAITVATSATITVLVRIWG
jgi:hypothetical protein